MRGFLAGVCAAWLAGAAPLDLDCSRPGEARALIGRVMLSEIEAVEDINRAALWNTFRGCPAGAAGEPCREEHRRRFEKDWDLQKARIEAKYQKMLREFEERCRASIT